MKSKTYFGSLRLRIRLTLLALLSMIATAIVSYYVALHLNEKGEPKIAARINALLCRQYEGTNAFEGAVFFEISNLENEETILRIDELVVSLDHSRQAYKFGIAVQLPAFEVYRDTIRFGLPARDFSTLDTVGKEFMVDMKIKYPTGDLAQEVRFENTYDRRVIVGTWQLLPNGVYQGLRKVEEAKLKALDWKKVTFQFKGKDYDFYQRPYAEKLQILFGESTVRIVPNNGEPGLSTMDEHIAMPMYDYVVEDKFKSLFENLNYRNISIQIGKRQNTIRVISGTRFTLFINDQDTE